MPASAWLTDPLVLARFLHFAGCVVAVGTAAFAVLAADAGAATVPDMERLHRRWRAIVIAAAAVAAVAGIAWLAVVAADILGTSVAEACLHGGLWSVASGTHFGQFASARLALALLLLVPVWAPRLRLALAVGLIVLIAPAGHAGAQVGAWGDVHLAVDAAHLAAAGAWLGGLPALAMLLGAAHRGPDELRAFAVRTTSRYSILGIVCVGVLLATGIVNSWFLLSGPADLTATIYGRVLALKIGLFVAMIVIAAVNRFHLTPQLGEAGAAPALQRNSVIEACLGLGVLFLVAVLGTLEPGAHSHEHTEIPTEAAFVHIHTSLAMADVTVDPGRAGKVSIRIHLANEDFTNYDARAVHLELRPPEADGAAITREAKQDTEAVWRVVGIDLPRPGIWTVRVTVAPQNGASFVIDGPIVIAP